ncbi:hypothetical protein BRC81_11455 [Halobacteriales archaeon QS_1_68_20]|nr:MAG: hypothetical protein BRC81_11455 [Halobacteriales archaeon QS_1_68_20]
MTSVLDHYAQPSDPGYEWTLVVNGDGEEFWADNDLTTNEPGQKVGDIASTHPDVYETMSEEFYKFEFPRRFVKPRGNHDAFYSDPHVVDSYRDEGFPDVEVYDYVTTQFSGEDLVILHGHQFDPYNCDANNEFGKFARNFTAEPVDVVSDKLDDAADLWGGDARIEGKTLEFDPLGIEIPLDFFAPYYEEVDWNPRSTPTGTRPR